MTAGDSVAVIVLTSRDDDIEVTADCLASLQRSHHPRLTTVLVDNASTNDAGRTLHERFPHATLIETGVNLGYTGGNNRGMEWALAHGADWVIVLNNDTIVDPDCIPRLLAAAHETGAAMVAPKITYYDEPQIVWYGGGVFAKARAQGLHTLENKPVDPAQTRTHVTFICGCCFLLRADVLRQVGGFDESFFGYVEDLELSVRVTRSGYALLYEPSALVLHRTPRRAEPTPFQIRQRDRNRRRLVRLHYGPWDRVRFATWFYPTRALHFARYACTGQWNRARAIAEGALGGLTASQAFERARDCRSRHAAE